LQVRIALRKVPSDLLMAVQPWKVVWSIVAMADGAQCVLKDGMDLMPWWSVGNSDIIRLVRVGEILIIIASVISNTSKKFVSS